MEVGQHIKTQQKLKQQLLHIKNIQLEQIQANIKHPKILQQQLQGAQILVHIHSIHKIEMQIWEKIQQQQQYKAQIKKKELTQQYKDIQQQTTIIKNIQIMQQHSLQIKD